MDIDKLFEGRGQLLHVEGEPRGNKSAVVGTAYQLPRTRIDHYVPMVLFLAPTECQRPRLAVDLHAVGDKVNQ